MAHCSAIRRLREGVTPTAQARGSLPAGTYNYRIVLVDAQGHEGASSDPTAAVTVDGAQGEYVLENLPAVTGEFVRRRIYRSTVGGVGPVSRWWPRSMRPDELRRTTALRAAETLDAAAFGVVRARPDARLKIDPGTVVKLEGARIEVAFRCPVDRRGLHGPGSHLHLQSGRQVRSGRDVRHEQ